MIQLSVVIPTHRRPDIVVQCLKHLEAQTMADQLEVIVVSDGPDDKTAERIAKSSWRIPVIYKEIPKAQQGAARNHGITFAQASTCLFLGDDIFLEPDACAYHVQPLSTTQTPTNLPTSYPLPPTPPFAVLGFTTWDPAVRITPVMRWLEKSGWQFGYSQIAAYAGRTIPTEIQQRYTYTSHISLPTEIAKKISFREDVSLYGWEDIEWGMRLRDAGVTLIYEPRARALHHHHLELHDSLKRIEILGQSAVEIAKKVPTFDRVPHGWKLLAYKIAALLPTMAGKHRAAFLRGMTS